MSGELVYGPLPVANYLINRALPKGLDALQVLKLVYIAHGFTLGLRGAPLIDDDIEAWKFGPVVRSIYSYLPGGAAPITEPLAGIYPAELDDEPRKLVDSVYDLYGNHSGLYLSNLTHRPGSPWHQVWTTYGRNAVIPRKLIEDHYERVIDEWNAAAKAGQSYVVPAL